MVGIKTLLNSKLVTEISAPNQTGREQASSTQHLTSFTSMCLSINPPVTSPRNRSRTSLYSRSSEVQLLLAMQLVDERQRGRKRSSSPSLVSMTVC